MEIETSRASVAGQPTVTVAIVTRDRLAYLKNLLASLEKSTYPLHSIHLIDNESSDGTWDYIDALPKGFYHPVRLNVNSGGAGGFNKAIELASKSGAEWIWVMDDDVEILPESLNLLFKWRGDSLCLHGARRQLNGERLPFARMLNTNTGFSSNEDESFFSNEEKTCDINVMCFEGMLVHRSVVEKIGLPDPRFFLSEDDADFGYRASKVTRTLFVNEVTIQKQLSWPRKQFVFGREYLSAPANYLYYSIRNKFLAYRKLRADGFGNPVAFAIKLIRYVTRVTLLYGVWERDPKKVTSIYQGVWHGLIGRFGIR